jgi:putative ABC transport system permease protein
MVMDLKIALRRIACAPTFAALVIATMAIGIGANATMFAVFHAVFLRPLPFPEPERLVTVWESDPERGVARQRVTGSNLVDWEAQSGLLEAMGTLPNWSGSVSAFNVIGAESVERVPGLYASSGFFRVLGVQPRLGRTFGPEEDRQSGRRTVVISHAYWRERFGGDPAVLGKTIEVDTFRGGAFTVIGVMPQGFDFPGGVKIWLSLADWGGGPLPPLDTAQRCCPWHAVFARLKPGVTPQRAAAELTAIARRISARHPTAPRVTDVRVVPLRDSLVGTHRLSLGALFGAVACVLLIGCANVANLLLSRGVGRRNELLTRMALGATRPRLARQLVIESLLLCGLGAIAGILTAAWAQGALARTFTGQITLVETTRMDAGVLGFAALLTVICGVVCGLAPLVGSGLGDFRSRGQTEGTTSTRLRTALVVCEVALAVTLVVSAGLLIRTLSKLQAVDVGFQMERILTVSMDLTTGPLRGRGHSVQFLEEAVARVSAMPGVQRAGVATGMPLEAGTAGQAITPENRQPTLAAASPQVVQSAVSPGYFATMSVPIVKGRGCTDADSADATLVSLLNETAARRYWPGEDPIGKRFTIGSLERFGYFRPPSSPGAIEWRTIVGVVADMRSAGFGADIQPEVYHCYKQFPIYEPQLFVRAAADPMALAPAIRQALASIDHRAVVVRLRTMEHVAGQSLASQRLRALLLGSFAALALALGMLGIYGVLSYTVNQRRREIGIRMALGADRTQVSRMIVWQALRLTATGIVLGLFGAFISARWIASLLFGVQTLDPLTFTVTCLLMLGSAILASTVPASRATRVDPAVALRSE